MRIIVADDEPDMREYLQTMLTYLGHEVLAVATNGEELIECCRRETPDLVISDLKMPGIDGLEAIQQIWKFADVAVLMISAYACPENIGEESGRPEVRYLNKPFNRQELRTALNSIPPTFSGRRPAEG
ncbi:MAG: response regulator [Rubinisphaera brasiliensis]|uniref:response regulator n=1 Tax=Rubinisphaera brasiliensis TaxID=119 RepID=UPI00391A87D3